MNTASARPGQSTSDVDVLGSFTRGVFSISIVSAEGSEGLQAWLDLQGFHVPDSGRPVLDEYIDSGVNFLVAHADLEVEDGMLEPLVLEMESIDGIPIRLGTINSTGVQDLTLVVADYAPVEVITYPQVFPQTECVYDPKNMGEPEAFYNAILDTAHAAQPAAWSLQYSDIAETYGLHFEDFNEAIVALASRGLSSNLTRIHVRYTPEAALADLQLGMVPEREAFHHRAFHDDPSARDQYDLCCDAWEGKRCPANTGGPACSIGTRSSWGLGLLAPMFLLFRRRR